ncbi:MAG: response regulator [Desulfatiglans sp.]|jgi:DNA-binding NtrC family response regulator|nr:response regulator [Thermodesulfobacteriota bacterium]MEE4353983.1 response regulator [Desulfatiglans sp.]
MADPRLLIVDDEERFLTTTKALLQKRGIVTFTSTNGTKAMEILERESIDVVILDVKMPGLDGVEVLRVIKKRHPLVEVIMLTGHASAESAVGGLNLGAFDYLMKPCDIQTLIDKINGAYAKKETALENLRKTKIDKIISHPLEVFDKDRSDNP